MPWLVALSVLRMELGQLEGVLKVCVALCLLAADCILIAVVLTEPVIKWVFILSIGNNIIMSWAAPRYVSIEYKKLAKSRNKESASPLRGQWDIKTQFYTSRKNDISHNFVEKAVYSESKVPSLATLCAMTETSQHQALSVLPFPPVFSQIFPWEMLLER